VSIEPRRPSPGALVRVTVDKLNKRGDSITSVIGEMAGEPLHFRAATGDRLQALGAVSAQVSDSAAVHIVAIRQSGARDTLRLWLRYAHQVPPATTPVRGRVRVRNARRLRVDRRFTLASDTASTARVARENEIARQIGERARNTPPLWTHPFLRPRAARVTSRFGSGRVFNGRLQSSHLGIDYRGAVGDPVQASNRGVVALVASFFLAGNVVYIDHGDGIVTGYFHMSRADVAVGDTVERGQRIGLVGATGRVTGPHLHWSARFGALTIDPADLLSLSAPFVVADTGRVAHRVKHHLFTR
jgi:murein DD-endopeptidase MepM/ murein hydrolase activator NlpD